MKRMNIGVLGSTRGTVFQSLIDEHSKGRLDVNFNIVISDNQEAYILKRAELYGIENYYIPHIYHQRHEFETKVDAILKQHKVKLILLIGFMKILSKWFCSQWKNAILNIHPSLLPAYAGARDMEIHHQVINNNEKYSGCTVHIVTENLDQGPIIKQLKLQVAPSKTPQDLKRRIQDLESKAYIEAIRYYSKHILTS